MKQKLVSSSGFIERELIFSRCHLRSKVEIADQPSTLSLSSQYALAKLHQREQFTGQRELKNLNIVDVCCGGGGFALGVKAATELSGRRGVIKAAIDVNRSAELLYRKNLRPQKFLRENLESLVRYENDPKLTTAKVKAADLDPQLQHLVGNVDLLIGGPPCQGNSNLNNKSRRSDLRNNIYLDAIALAIAVDAKVIALENVPSITASHQDIIARSCEMLSAAGYTVSDERLVLDSADFCSFQSRRRHILLASKSGKKLTKDDFSLVRLPPCEVGTLLQSLHEPYGDSYFDTPANLSPENEARVNYLHEHDVYDLPDSQRPDCHRLKEHSYNAVYGRMFPDRPAPTITSGFTSPGRGRFTHPLYPRALTLREGALIQGFNFTYDWLEGTRAISKAEYATVIGDAVPPPLGEIVGAAAISLIEDYEN